MPRFTWNFLRILILFFFVSLLDSAYGFQGTFDQTMSLEGKILAQFRVTTKQDKVRMEILHGQEPEFVIENSEGYYRVYPGKKFAIQMPRVDKHTFLDDLDDFDNYLKVNQGQKKGNEKLGDKETEIYEYMDPMSKQKGQVWLSKDSRLPLKIEVPTPQGTLKIEFSDFDTDSVVDDSAFAIPEDVNVISHEQIMAQYGEAMEKQQVAQTTPEPQKPEA